MPITGTSVAQSVAGIAATERVAAKASEKRDPLRARKVRRGEDEVVLGAAAVDVDDPVRRQSGNDQEEAREDRHAHAGYSPDGKLANPTVPRIDVAG